MTTLSVTANNLIFDTALFDYSVKDNFVLVPQKRFEESKSFFDYGSDDLLSNEDVADIRQAREEFKRGEYYTAEQVRQKYGL